MLLLISHVVALLLFGGCGKQTAARRPCGARRPRQRAKRPANGTMNSSPIVNNLNQAGEFDSGEMFRHVFEPLFQFAEQGTVQWNRRPTPWPQPGPSLKRFARRSIA